MDTKIVKAIVPSWEWVYYENPSSASSNTVSLVGATVTANGGTHIKKNTAPKHSTDYDVRCDSDGNLSGETLENVTCIYIWGYGYTIDGTFYDCEREYDNATQIEIADDTEITLWGVNSE